MDQNQHILPEMTNALIARLEAITREVELVEDKADELRGGTVKLELETAAVKTKAIHLHDEAVRLKDCAQAQLMAINRIRNEIGQLHEDIIALMKQQALGVGEDIHTRRTIDLKKMK